MLIHCPLLGGGSLSLQGDKLRKRENVEREKRGKESGEKRLFKVSRIRPNGDGGGEIRRP